MELKIRLVGVKEIDQVLKGLPTQINHKLVQQANFQASKYLVEEAKNTAPEGPTGNTVDSIGTIRQSFARSSELGLTQSGPRRGGRYKGHYAHLIEYGTRSRSLKNGANRGVMPARPFMLPAWVKTKYRILSSINVFLAQALLRFMRRTIKNG
jgi:hypothetical protein